jgi:hypothetical protein
MLSTIAEITRDLLIFVGVIAALLVALIVVASKMPNTNPLKRTLTALCYRLAATLAAGAVAIPLEPIPGIDLFYDIGVPIVLICPTLIVSEMPPKRAATFFGNSSNVPTAANRSSTSSGIWAASFSQSPLRTRLLSFFARSQSPCSSKTGR